MQNRMLHWNTFHCNIGLHISHFTFSIFYIFTFYISHFTLLWREATRELTRGEITLLQPFRALADLYDQPRPPFSRKENCRWIWNEGRNIEWNEISEVEKNGEKGGKTVGFTTNLSSGHLYDHSVSTHIPEKQAEHESKITMGRIYWMKRFAIFQKILTHTDEDDEENGGTLW